MSQTFSPKNMGSKSRMLPKKHKMQFNEERSKSRDRLNQSV